MNAGTAVLTDQIEAHDQDTGRRWAELGRATKRISEFLSSEDLESTGEEEADIAVIPGRAINLVLMERERTIRALRNLIHRFARDGFTWPTGESITLPMDTAAAANRLLDLLPEQIPLPKVGPEEEGGLVLAWEANSGTHLLILDGWRYDLVENAGTRQARYFDNQRFEYGSMPEPLRMIFVE